jgi:hypothetical protein
MSHGCSNCRAELIVISASWGNVPAMDIINRKGDQGLVTQDLDLAYVGECFPSRICHIPS